MSTLDLINDAWSRDAVASFVVRARKQGFKVQEFVEGWSFEVDGAQVFRATHMGNERYAVRYNERMFPDV